MDPRTSISRTLLAAAAGLSLVGAAHAQQPTPITDLVIYGLDGDYGVAGEGGAPGRLFRFVPSDGSYQNIGPTILAGTSTQLWDWESLAFVPSGPTMGAYSVPCEDQAGSARQKLVRISLFDASGTIVGNQNLGNVRGMTPFKNAAGQWRLLAFRTSGSRSYFMVINPATGAREAVAGWPLAGGTELEVNVRLFGLAMDPTGAIFGVSHQGIQSQIYSINTVTGAATALGPPANAPRVEALEVAVGDSTPAFSGLPAATAGWPFQRGVMMGFADDDATLYIFNQLTGAGVPLTSIAGNPISVPWTDVEGLVFLTRYQDPQSPVFDGFD